MISDVEYAHAVAEFHSNRRDALPDGLRRANPSQHQRHRSHRAAQL